MASNPLQIPICSTYRGTQTPPASPSCSLLVGLWVYKALNSRAARDIEVSMTKHFKMRISLVFGELHTSEVFGWGPGEEWAPHLLL